MAELFDERARDRFAQLLDGLAFGQCRAQLRGGDVDVGGVDEIKDALGRWLRCRFGFFGLDVEVGIDLGFDSCDLRVVENLCSNQVVAQAQNRIAQLRFGELFGGAVEVVGVGVAVRTHANALGMKHHGTLAAAGMLDGFLHRAHRVEDVGAVAVDHAQVLDAAEVVGDV